MNEENRNRLNLYKKSLESAWGYNDYNDWPIKVNSIMHLFLKEFASEIIEDIKQIDANELLKLFGNPARIYRIIDPTIFGMKRMKLPLEFQREIVLKMLDYVKLMKAGSEFNEDGRNNILSKEQVEVLFEQYQFTKTDKQSAGTIQKFCGILWAYTESIFFRAHEVTKEIHGMYELGEGKNLVIREYLNLQPYHLWDETVPFLKYQKIVIYTVYNAHLKLVIDSYNHLFLKEGNYKDDMIEYIILADGKRIDVEELNSLIADAMKTIMEIHRWVDVQDWRVIANKYADIYWYRKRPFREVLKKNYQVPDIVRENIANGLPDERRKHNLSEKEIGRLIRTMI